MVRSQPLYGPNVNGSPKIASLEQALSMLRARKDGPFYLVATYQSPSSASATLNAINHGKRKVPEGKYEYHVNVRKDISRSYLYARRIE